MKPVLFTLLLAIAVGVVPAVADEIDVSAAASLQDALRAVAHEYEVRTHDRVVFNFAGSNTLARQIRAGAPVDIFLSADEAQMDAVRDLVTDRRTLLTNRLVIATDRPFRGPEDFDLMRRIAIGEPSSVPAGVYAREWLRGARLWDEVARKLVPTSDVRAALALLDSGDVDAAFVYATDLRVAKRPHAAWPVPNVMARYPMAVVKGARHTKAAHRFAMFLRSPEALRIFETFGFRKP